MPAQGPPGTSKSASTEILGYLWKGGQGGIGPMSDKKKVSRREAVKTMGSYSLLPLLAQLGPGGVFASNATSHRLIPPEKQSKAWAPKFLDAHQNQTVTVISELIIPETETPGAKAARVNEFIDLMLSEESPEVQQGFLRGLAWVDRMGHALFGADFIALNAEQQISILTGISSAKNVPPEDRVGVTFFKEIKNRTIFAYYTSEIGIHRELQYKGNAVLGEFQGCTHPEHLKWGPKG